MTSPVVLADRAIISLSGPDTRSLLQGLITNDIARLSPERPLYAALLTPQGKILFDFLLFERATEIVIDCAAPTARDLAKRLSLYRLRAKVQIDLRDDLKVVASWDDAVADGHADPRLSALGTRKIIVRSDVANGDSGADTYLAHRLALGVPEGADFGQDRLFALDADLEELHGVAFDKGCYVGQELTARMKHRGTARKRLVPVVTEDGGDCPPHGETLLANGRDVGTVVSVHGGRGFALVRLDRLAEAGDAAMEAAGMRLTIVRPSWLFA
jgi:hypothetical protein